MDNSKQDILSDIESTLNELIEVGSALKEARFSTSFPHEIEALEKTQESLLARLIHRESLLVEEPKKKMLRSIRKEMVEKKIADSAVRQKRASFRRASSKS